LLRLSEMRLGRHPGVLPPVFRSMLMILSVERWPTGFARRESFLA
jgi:hypothetical protein